MTNNDDNQETRSYTALLAHCKNRDTDVRELREQLGELKQEYRRAHAGNIMLQTKVAQMRITIADYERAHAVAEAMAQNNDVMDTTNWPVVNNAPKRFR